jgi:Secretion system C-terminal sorting domain
VQRCYAQVSWTIRTSAADNLWRSVAYGTVAGNGLFVAVANSGTGDLVMTSTDGITWTSRTPALNNQWLSVTYGTVAGNGLFVAVAIDGTGNRVMTSPDGITWTSRASAADNQWRSVTYAAGLFVAVASDGTGNRVMTSPDGITWTSRTSAADNSWNSVTYAAGLFVAVAATGTGNRVMTSPDGITWTIRTSATDNNWRSVTYGNGLFVAVASTGVGNRVMTSAAALPVNLLYFRGKAGQSAEGYASELTWATDSEVNAKSYTIERSRDLQTFTTLNNQPAAGNSTEQKEYAYTDSKPFFGTNYYRLSQTDFDGSVHRYQPVAVIIEDRDMPFGVFPNPVSGNRFKVKVENADEAQLSLFNELGQKISIETSKLSETIVEVQAKTELPTGSYVVQVKGLTTIKTYKIMMNNE